MQNGLQIAHVESLSADRTKIEVLEFVRGLGADSTTYRRSREHPSPAEMRANFRRRSANCLDGALEFFL